MAHRQLTSRATSLDVPRTIDSCHAHHRLA
jgi:hypothetical protein